MNIFKKTAYSLVTACVLLCTLTFTGCTSTPKTNLDPNNPITITLWNYYTGAQLAAFRTAVDKFNATRGKELGVIVEASSEGSVSDLENNVIAALNKEIGAKDAPNIFAAYSDTAFSIDKMGYIADISEYFTDAERAEYVDSYLLEGDLDRNGKSIKIFPIAKSTEIFMLNKTDWTQFSEATGATVDELATIEGVTEVAKEYYEWSGGRALFGRDALANYIFIGAMQLGVEIVSHDENGNEVLSFPKEQIRKLWDNFYIPYVNGYFSSNGKFRSDDVKTGEIISFVGSSTSVSFFPKEVILGDNNIYSIESIVLPAPKFADSEDYAIQQGAGMVVTKGTPAEVEASVEFLKWFTDVENNIEFALSSGYLPVKKVANSMDKINEYAHSAGISTESIKISVDTVNSNTMYTPPATTNGASIRSILEYSMTDAANEDRETVERLLASGKTREEALEYFLSDVNFDNWYEETKQKLEDKFN